MNDQTSLTAWVRTDDLSRYPASHVRAEADTRLIAEYAQAMLEGAEFPPVIIFEDEDGARYLADGLHRTDAAALAALKEPDRQAQVRAQIRRGTLTDALVYAMQANVRHGKRLTEADYKRQIELALEFGLIPLNRADIVVPELVRLLGCSVRTAQVCSADKRRELRAERDRSILAMHRSGWTQERIADAVDVEQATVSRVIERSMQERSDAKMHKQDKRIDPPVARFGPEDDAAEKAEAQEAQHEVAASQVASPDDEPRYRINVSPYLPLLDALRPLEDAGEDSGAIVEVPDLNDDETEATKSATSALGQISVVLSNMLHELDQPKGMQRRYPAKAAESALDALERAIEFLTDLEEYVKDGIRR